MSIKNACLRVVVVAIAVALPVLSYSVGDKYRVRHCSPFLHKACMHNIGDLYSPLCIVRGRPTCRCASEMIIHTRTRITKAVLTAAP